MPIAALHCWSHSDSSEEIVWISPGTGGPYHTPNKNGPCRYLPICAPMSPWQPRSAWRTPECLQIFARRPCLYALPPHTLPAPRSYLSVEMFHLYTHDCRRRFQQFDAGNQFSCMAGETLYVHMINVEGLVAMSVPGIDARDI